MADGIHMTAIENRQSSSTSSVGSKPIVIYNTPNMSELKKLDRRTLPRKKFTLEEKKEICRYKINHPKLYGKDIATRFNKKWGCCLANSTISKILGNSDYILQQSEKNKAVTRIYNPRYRHLEAALFLWYTNFKDRLKITNNMLRDKSKEISKGLNISQFQCSKKWMHAFKKRHNILKFTHKLDVKKMKTLNIDLDYDHGSHGDDMATADKLIYDQAMSEGTIRVLSPITSDEAKKGLMAFMAYMATKSNPDSNMKYINMMWEIFQNVFPDNPEIGKAAPQSSDTELDHEHLDDDACDQADPCDDGMSEASLENQDSYVTSEHKVLQDVNEIKLEMEPDTDKEMVSCDDDLSWMLQNKIGRLSNAGCANTKIGDVPILHIIQPMDPVAASEVTSPDHLYCRSDTPVKEEVYSDSESRNSDMPDDALKITQDQQPHLVQNKVYTCKVCGISYPQLSPLLSHVQTTHQVQDIDLQSMYQCQTCKLFLVEKSDFDDHIKTHLEEVVYKCPLCTECFNISSVKAHIASKHGHKYI